MTEISTIGLDLAKNVFQAHGANAACAPMFRKKLRRDQVLAFFAAQPPCLVAMEACPGAHHWGREIGKLGHTVKPPAPALPCSSVRSATCRNRPQPSMPRSPHARRPTLRLGG